MTPRELLLEGALSAEQLRSTGAFLLQHQDPSGAIPWWRG